MKEHTYQFDHVQNWITIGFFLAFFRLNDGIGYLTSFIGLLCLYTGMRILRSENQSYAKAYHASLFLLVFTSLTDILLATSWKLRSIIPILSLICVIVLLYGYTQGMEQVLIDHHEKPMIQNKRIFREYCCYGILFLFTLIASPWLEVITWIALVLLIIILIQIIKVHRRLHQILPEYSILVSGPPVAIRAVGILIAVLLLVVGMTYQTYRTDTLNIVLWHTQDVTKKEALIQKGLPKEIVEDLSQDTIEKLQVVTAFHLCKEVTKELQVESYAGLDTNGSLHYLGYIDLDVEGIEGNCALLPQMIGSLSNQYGSMEEIAVLYDQEKQTYGYAQQTPYEFPMAKGTHHRGYVYMTSNVSQQSLFEAEVKLKYRNSWFHYPYEELDLNNGQRETKIEQFSNKGELVKRTIASVDTQDLKE